MPLDTPVHFHKRKRSTLDLLVAAATLAALVLLALCVSNATADTDGSAPPADSGGAGFAPTPTTTPGLRAKLSADGRTALAPEGAPQEVKDAITAANRIVRKPYIYGGGHATFKRLARGYDCSGTVSWALGNAGLLKSGPLDSSSFMRWGKGGKGSWITVYTNPGHAYVYIAGLRLDTSGPGQKGPRWRTVKRSNKGFRARHPRGL
jgi:cell wall-associated NlpC family hydrolase